MILTSSGCTSEIVPGEVREPRCEARSNTDPARLYLSTNANNYGLIEPCESYIEVYINKNTDLKSIDVKMEVLKDNEIKIHYEEIYIELEDKGFGTFQKKVPLNLINGEMCRNLTLRILNVNCNNSTREEIECPDLAIVTSYSFHDFDIVNESLNICYTNS